MDLSFWELNSFIRNRTLVVIGSGIVGLNAAICFKKKHPKSTVLVLERGVLPMGASTKNAGFACFGSVSELLSDLDKMPEKTVFDTVEMRLMGLKRLKKIIGKKNMDFQLNGGHEVFDKSSSFDRCAEAVPGLNKRLKSITGSSQTFKVNVKSPASFGLKGFSNIITTELEGQIDSGKAMKKLLELAISLGITVLNNITVSALEQSKKGMQIELENGVEISCENVIVATNGFARRLMPELEVVPARAQVLITKPINQLKLKGNFHYDEGFYYFRNFQDRVLFGGGRNLNFLEEETDEFGLTEIIQKKLNKILKENILPSKKFEIDHRWSGIMGVGSEKKPIIKKLSKNLVVAVRMGGMGVAIGSLVGERAVEELEFN